MSLTYVQGDIFLSQAQAICFGSNAKGQAETSPLATEWNYRYPAAYASFRKHVRAGRLKAGSWWTWHEATPWLSLLVIRESAAGATRMRYLEAAVQNLARDWWQAGLQSLAIAQLGTAEEWPELKQILDYWLASSALPVVVYETHITGQKAHEPWDVPPD